MALFGGRQRLDSETEFEQPTSATDVDKTFPVPVTVKGRMYYTIYWKAKDLGTVTRNNGNADPSYFKHYTGMQFLKLLGS